MSGWVVGAVLVGGGVAWLVLRMILSRTRGLSTLSKPLRAIRYLPVVGVLWRFFPQLMVVAGIIWITNAVGEPGVDEAAGAPDAAPGTLCGVAESRPAGVAEADWPRYRCEGESVAGERWAKCLRRSQYTEIAGRGCPGAERCCPK